MQVIHHNGELRDHIHRHRKAGKTIGLVPTMGFLHRGHISLIERARRENEVVVVSIFVNPTQFGPNEDIDAYPRNIPGDLKILNDEQTDIAFLPTADELYPEGYATYVEVAGPITQVLCGRSRPTHFRGVATVVSKLFHLTQPHRAYFGQKDFQQVAVLKQMVRDLNFDLEVVACPTVREADGLAMSSRNANLTPAQRAQAPQIAQALHEARDMIRSGEREAQVVTSHLKKRIAAIDSAVIDYVSLADARSLMEIDSLDGPVLIAVAVKLGPTRLIDNIVIEA